MKIIPTASVVLASVFLGACNQENHQAAWWDAEKERIEVSQQLELKKYRLEQSLGSEFGELQKLRAASEKLAARKEALESRWSVVSAEVKAMEEEWAGFRQSVIQGQRELALGKSYDKFVLASGRSFEKVTISEINDSGVTIRHSDGSARVRFEDLNAEQRWLFGLEEDLAIAAHQKESEGAAEYEKWVDARLASNQAKRKEESAKARQAELAAADSRARARQMVSANVSTLSKPSSTVSSSGGRYYRSRPTYYSTSYYNYSRPTFSRCYSAPVRSVRDFMRQNRQSQTSFANTTIP